MPTWGERLLRKHSVKRLAGPDGGGLAMAYGVGRRARVAMRRKAGESASKYSL